MCYKTENFIQRWGTHYIKSARFGGQLEIRKRMDAKEAGTKTQFSEKMEFEYKSLFASVGAKYSKQGGTSARQQTKTTSTEVEAKGGSQDIASILSDMYSPTFKTEFKEWLQSIPRYPKAYKFLMGSITDLVNFRANDLFPDEKVCTFINLPVYGYMVKIDNSTERTNPTRFQFRRCHSPERNDKSGP